MADLRDPRVAALRGRLLTQRLQTGVRESLAELYAAEENLEGLGPSFFVQKAVSDAIEAFDRLSRYLPAHVARDWREGSRLAVRFERIDEQARASCDRAVSREPAQ